MRLLSLAALAVVCVVDVGCASAPKGTAGPAADALAARVESAVGIDAWNSLAVVSFHFRDHQWLWDKARGVVQLTDGDGTVLIDTWDRGGFVVDDAGNDVTGDAAASRLTSAWAAFINDSFWLNPLATLRNSGATRELVTLEGEDAGAAGLLVRYESGGVTPGDAYLFIVDDAGTPARWKLWVQILPIKGFETTFEDWVDVDGAKIATSHKAAGANISLNPVKGGKSVVDVFGSDPFARLIARRR